MEELKKAVSKIIHLTAEEWELLTPLVEVRKYAAKTLIANIGMVAKKLYFIKKGLIRVYHLEDGKEISTYFACENQFISIYSSLITQTPSLEYLETITESEVLSINYHQLTALYTRYHKLEKIGRILAEKNYLCIMQRTLVMQTQTAKQKYLDFLATNAPQIIQNTPQHQIASFLGITPESLSRIRKDLVK